MLLLQIEWQSVLWSANFLPMDDVSISPTDGIAPLYSCYHTVARTSPSDLSVGS